MTNDEFIYGFHSVKKILQTRPQDVIRLLLQDNRHDHRFHEIVKLAEEYHVKYEVISKAQLEKILDRAVSHQGIMVRCKPLSTWNEKTLLSFLENKSDSVLLLILDGVQDPHNLGACLRSANAFGVNAVIVPKDRAATLTDVVRKVACGAAEQTPFVAVTNLNRMMMQLKEQGVWMVGLDAEASLTLSQVDLTGKIGIVLGGEGGGLRRLTKESCDYLAKIPMVGNVESLNVSVATGVALYEVCRHINPIG